MYEGWKRFLRRSRRSKEPQDTLPAAAPGLRRVAAPHAGLCAVTDFGLGRDHNEDAFYLSDGDDLIIVADGMGGHRAGEVASELAIAATFSFLKARDGAGQDEDASRRTLVDALENAHQAVVRAALGHDEWSGMGTTFIAARIEGDRLCTCHVGDVRCYLKTRDGLEQVTTDHSVVEEWVRRGELSREEARVHPQRHEITQALGKSTRIRPEVSIRTLEPGDQVVLCSDGLTQPLDDRQLASSMDEGGTVEDVALRLVDRALEAGGEDNVTVVVYEYRAEGEQDSRARRS